MAGGVQVAACFLLLPAVEAIISLPSAKLCCAAKEVRPEPKGAEEKEASNPRMERAVAFVT